VNTTLPSAVIIEIEPDRRDHRAPIRADNSGLPGPCARRQEAPSLGI